MKLTLIRLLSLLVLLTPGATAQALDYTYVTIQNEIWITGYNGPGGAVTVPNWINGLPVTCITQDAFRYDSSVTNIAIPGNISQIDTAAFATCYNLKVITVYSDNLFYSSLDGVLFDKNQNTLIEFPAGRGGNYTIPGTATSIGDCAFYYCSGLASVTVPNTVTNVGDYAFYYCSGLGQIVLPDSIAHIGDYAFYNCSALSDVKVPNRVTKIGNGVFYRCTGLRNVTIPNSVTNIGYSAFSECLGVTNISLGNSVTSIGNGAFSFCRSLTSIAIPDSVSSIGTEAFMFCESLTSFTIPNHVTSIGVGTFNNCVGLTNVIIPDSVSSIGTDAFEDCVSLTNVIIGNSVTNIGDAAFYGCSNLANAAIPNSVTSIGVVVFEKCASLATVTLGSGVTNIGTLAFDNCISLTAITVDSANPTYSSLGGVLFNKNLTTLIQYPGGKAGGYIIPPGVTSVGTNAFADCAGLTSVTIPNSVITIGDNAFSCCGDLNNVTIGNGVTGIGYGAFQYCTSLTNVAIGNRLTGIGDLAFLYCTNLVAVSFSGNAPAVGEQTFAGDTQVIIYYLPGTLGWGATFAGLPTVARVAPTLPYTVIKSFGMLTNVSGYNPGAPLVQGPDGALYGTTSQGEGPVLGTVFRLNGDGTGFRVIRWFTNSLEAAPSGGLVLSGSTLYGTTSSDGVSVVFKLNTDGSGYTVLKRFAGSTSGYPPTSILLSGSTLYGTTSDDGIKGAVFRLNTDGSGYTVLNQFTGSNGAYPCAGLVLSGNTLYGTTLEGGSSFNIPAFPPGYGTVFKVNTDGSGFAVLRSFTLGDGKYPCGGLVLAGNVLYGATEYGGNGWDGVVFQLNTDGSGYIAFKNFGPGDAMCPSSGLVLAGSTLYGVARGGGSWNCGAVFKINTDMSGYAVLKSFTGSDGVGPNGLLLAGNTLYGTTQGGGCAYSALNNNYGFGVVFKLNTDGSGYAVLQGFALSDGRNPSTDLVLSGDTLYGTTQYGGSFDSGTVFKVSRDGSGYAVLKSFTGMDGASPCAGLVLAGTTLYGTTLSGGSSNCGVIFRLGRDGSGYTVLKNFSGSDGAYPSAGLVLAGNTLYGVTRWGGSSDCGAVFKVNTDGSSYTVLKNFTLADGAYPSAGLVLAGNTLYGTTSSGGTLNHGVVFEVSTDSSSYSVLKSFTGIDGDNPAASLLLSGSRLYGTTQYGGSSMTNGSSSTGYGTVFVLNTDGSGYSVLTSFAGGIEGEYPCASLGLAGGTLYGTTEGGGSLPASDSPGGRGVVFKVSTEGVGYKVLKVFTGADGQRPNAGLVLANGNLLGTTTSGGDFNYGLIFSLPCIAIDTPPVSQTAEPGSTVEFRVEAASVSPDLAYQWFFDETNAIAGATGPSLELTNVQAAQAGSYTVVVTSSAAGALTSPPAMLNLVVPVERRVVPAVILPASASDLLHIEYADSLAASQWSSFPNTVVGSGPQFCIDRSEALPAQRFYRAWQTNGARPALGATMATEIPLTGAIGSSMRVDYINSLGPTGAWVTLGTVLLTNTPQYYYDLTAFGHPTRLYRLVPGP